MRVGQERARRRRRRARCDQDRAGLRDGAKGAGNRKTILAVRRARLDREARCGPIERGELGPADAGMQCVGAERVEIASNRARNLRERCERFDGARHVGRASDEAGTEVRRHRRTRALPMRGDIRGGANLRLRVGTVLGQRFAHARENRVARRPVRVGHFAHDCQLIFLRMKSATRVTPFSIASFDVA